MGWAVERQARYAWLPIAIPILALFGPALVTDTSFPLRDAGHFYHPLFRWCAGEWSEGRVPLWNPADGCGAAVLADATASVFYPGKLIFALPLRFPLAYKLYVVLHVALAAASSYVLARRWGGSPSAAAVAAICYACGGSVVFQYCNVVFLVGAAWLPLAALFIERMLVGMSWKAAVWLALVLAMMILGGDPQAALHALLLAALYAMLLLREQPAAAGLLVRRGGYIGLAAVATLLLAAVQIVPSAEAARLSERAAFNRPRNVYEIIVCAARRPADDKPLDETAGKSILRGLFMTPEEGSHHERIYDFSVGPWRLIEYVWPNVGGRMFPTHRRWMTYIPAEGRTWTPTLYMGVLPLVLALLSTRLLGGTPRIRWLTWIALVFTLGSFGYYGLGWLLAELGLLRGGGERALAPGAFGVYWCFVTFLPSYVYFRYPAKLLTVAALAISQLAARQFDRAFEPRATAILPRVLLGLAALSGVAAGLAWLTAGHWLLRIGGGDSLLGPFDGRGAGRDIVLAFAHTAIVALLGRQLLVRGRSLRLSTNARQLGIALLVGVEIALANYWLVVTAPASIWQSESAIAEAIHATEAAVDSGQTMRVFRGNLATWRPGSFRKVRSSYRLAEMAQWEHDTLFPKHHLGQEISLVEAFSSLKAADYESFLKVAKQHGPRQPDRSLLPQPTALRLLGTQYLVLPENHEPAFAERIEGAREGWPENTALWRMRRTLPRAWIAHDVVALPPLAPAASLDAIDKRSYEVLFPSDRPRDFLHQAVIEADSRPAASNLAPHSSDGAEHCEITLDQPQHVRIDAWLDAPGLLVLSDAWYPGWKATVTRGGRAEEAPIHRTNRVMRGVWLPAGASTVDFVYKPRLFWFGAVISGLAWFALAAIWISRRTLKSSSSARA